MFLDVGVVIIYAIQTAMASSRLASGTDEEAGKRGAEAIFKARPEGYEGDGPDEVRFYEVYEYAV